MTVNTSASVSDLYRNNILPHRSEQVKNHYYADFKDLLDRTVGNTAR